MARADGLLLTVALTSFLALPATGNAHGSCEALRLKAAGARCKGMLHCYASAAKRGATPDTCAGSELARLEAQFDRAEFIDGESCPPFGEPADVIGILDVLSTDLAQSLVLGVDKCSRTKIAGAAKQCVVQIRNCHATAHRKEIPVEASCLDAAAEKASRVFAKAENRFSCTTNNDSASVDARVEQAVDEVVTELTIAP